MVEMEQPIHILALALLMLVVVEAALIFLELLDRVVLEAVGMLVLQAVEMEVRHLPILVAVEEV